MEIHFKFLQTVNSAANSVYYELDRCGIAMTSFYLEGMAYSITRMGAAQFGTIQ